MVFKRRMRLLAGALIVACIVLVGPSAPTDGPFARSMSSKPPRMSYRTAS